MDEPFDENLSDKVLGIQNNLQVDSILLEASGYFPRKFSVINASILDTQVDEAGILGLPGNKIVLGEPGMGKSKLMRELGRRLGVEVVPAIRFIGVRDPTKLVPVGKPLLIDGLDEAMSRRKGDAIDAIVRQLEEAGTPPFILSCRSREWQSRSVARLRQLYRTDPTILTLEPFDRAEAHTYLDRHHPSVDADQVLDHLAAHSLDELYRNPLMLGLMGQVAESDNQLPATRAVLFERVCAKLWPEHDHDRQDYGLAQLAQDGALDAAGAIAAGLLFAGAEAASAAGAMQVQQNDLRLVDLEMLPQAKAARVIFSSKLFHSIGLLRAKPIHRVIAEYLGARWLALQVPTPRGQRRLLAQLHGSGAVPASLRGIHAWLAYHSPVMAERVISADPYGVLRYGETAVLTTRLANRLFDALCVLAEEDPFFRSMDWDSKMIAGLMIPVLKPRINATIESATSSMHLRSLLIEGLEDSPLAAELAHTLEAIVLSREHSYRERSYAADALLPHRDRAWWRHAIEALTNQSGDDSPRLACQLIQHIHGDVSDGLLVATIFAEMEVTSCSVPRRDRQRIHRVRYYGRLFNEVSSDRLVGLLDLTTDYTTLLNDGDWESYNEVSDIVAKLFVRAIDDGVIGPGDAPAAWRWLRIIEHTRRYSHQTQQALAQRLATQDLLRRAIQSYVMDDHRLEHSVSVTEVSLQRRLVGLSARPGDLIYALDRLALGDTKNQKLRENWKDLVRIGWSLDGLDPDVYAAAERFRRGDKQLEDYLRKLKNPRKPPWQVKQEKEAAKRLRSRHLAYEAERRDFLKIRSDLRAGKLGATLQPAKAYFGRFPDLPSELSPSERLAVWLGSALRDDALIGFEAVLHRTDLPTATEVAKGFAEGTFYSYGYPIMAGLFERVRSGRGIADLSESLKLTAYLLSHEDFGWTIENEKQVVQKTLEVDVIPTSEAREAFARTWVEPGLLAGTKHVAGVSKLAHDPEWQITGAALSAGWLTTFPRVPETVEASLVDCLTHGGALGALRDVAEIRANMVFRNFRHMLSWLAIDVLVRFEKVLPDLAGIGERNPEFIWFLRDRLQFERHGRILPLTIAQAEWIIAEFRKQWSYAMLEGSGSGDTNDYDATDFLRSLISQIADNTSFEANEALRRLVTEPGDSYSELIRHMAVQQRQKRAETSFAALSPVQLTALLADGPPGNVEDLKALVLEEMDVVRRKLLGNDLDSVIDFWTDLGEPRDENRCRDRLAEMISPELTRYDIQRVTEADMPMTKRADLVFVRGVMQLPAEVKGQWHEDVWDAAVDQLDVQYLIDWRSEQRGIYCVLWFGNVPSVSGRRLKPHPDGLPAPATADEMRIMLIARIPEARRPLISVVVFDFTARKS